ncbi:RNA polymerase sigma factor sigB isoform X1 [Iris pallida]|uniref:RNA polymerase sigma factor n=2 Tax=Iris pallida TaxID=29817 RepID=A0AAX6E632_IRIPA|nr:RNA polymerase sigma factor sigB isoform X1 [Iris pallida]
MACLVVPQFKCPSPTTTTLSSSSSESGFRPSHYGHVKARDYVCFRTHCALSTVTVVADIEKLQIPLREANSDSVPAASPLTYIGANDSHTKMDFEAAMSKEFLLMDDEAVIAVAAAEAITLARAAVEVAKDAVQMTATNPSVKSDKSEYFLSEADILQIARVRLSRSELVGTFDYSSTSTIKPVEENIAQKNSTNTEIPSSTQNEFQQIHHLKKNTVRSGRQKERRARRARLAEKTAVTVASVKNGSTGRKKRVVLQDIDYSDPLRYLRGTTSTSRLLTASEELELSEGIQDLLKLEKVRDELEERNVCQPTFAQWAAAAGVDQRTLRKRLNYGILCKDKMIKSNIRLVISIAKNYQGAGMNLQDLVQEGCRGLVKGAEKFDASKGFKFSTYAHWWIKQAVRKSLSDQSRTIRLPFHMVEATYRVREARKQLYSKNRKYPDDKEIAEVAGLTMKRLEAVMLTPKAPRSLDQKIGINQNLKPSEVIADPDAATTEDILIKQFMKQDLHKVLDSLSPREKQVVRWRFGLEDGRMKTLQEIGELMGVSRERIRQIESCAFRKLKNKKRTRNLQQYVHSQA